MHENRETSGTSRPNRDRDRPEKANRRTAGRHAPEESDWNLSRYCMRLRSALRYGLATFIGLLLWCGPELRSDSADVGLKEIWEDPVGLRVRERTELRSTRPHAI